MPSIAAEWASASTKLLRHAVRDEGRAWQGERTGIPTGASPIDLTIHPPRSPFATLGGVRWLPRMIDRARASLAGTLGEYDYPTAVDRMTFEFFRTDADSFLAAVRDAPDDEDLLALLLAARGGSTSVAEIEAFNERISSRSPAGDPRREASFRERLAATNSGRTDITTFFALLAIEEGHEVPPQ
jgi:hypothetical protein